MLHCAEGYRKFKISLKLNAVAFTSSELTIHRNLKSCPTGKLQTSLSQRWET